MVFSSLITINRLLLKLNRTFNTLLMNKKIVHTVFEHIAEKHPDKIAVRNENTTISYRDLNYCANQLSRCLQTLGVEKGNIVGVFTVPGISLVQSVLGIFKAGGVYLPVDINLAEAGLRQVFSDCQPGILIAGEENAAAVKSLVVKHGLDIKYLIVCSAGNPVIYRKDGIKFLKENTDFSSFSSANPELISEPDDSNYIFYTSGSTGVAKAILGCHKGLGHFINWEIGEFGLDDTCTSSFLSQFTFDASLRDIFVPLCAGGTLCIPSAETKTNTLQLLEWINENNISLVHCVPSLFRLMVKELESFNYRDNIAQHLQYILMAGEPLYAKDINNWRTVMGDKTELVNLYGTSETTMAKTFHRIKQIPGDSAQAIHVGKPISNTVVAVFNGSTPCSPGEIGEIYIKTPFMTKGYYNNDQQTKEVFVQNPLVTDRTDIMHKTGDFGKYNEDGTIEVLGRKDEQVKVNGIRVELGEIRKKVSGIEHIEEVEVIAIKKNDMGNDLVCYYTGKNYNTDELKELLKATLNQNITPAYFIHLEKFPLTLNGKIDKKALPRPEELVIREEDYVPSQGEIEHQLEAMWVEILGLKKTGRAVSFFKIGGNSIKAMQLISKIYKAFHVEVKITEIFSNQTIQKLAELIQDTGQKQQFSGITPSEQREHYDLSLAQKGVYLACQAGTDHIAYNIPLSYQLEGRLNAGNFIKAFETLVSRHESLRTTFFMNGGVPVQKVHEATSFSFTVEYTDLRDDSNNSETARRMADEQATAVFELENGPLIKASLLRLADENYVFLLTMHHIISDGWSMEMLVYEIVTLYNAFNDGKTNPLSPLRIQYKDYVAWQKKQMTDEAMAKSREYWFSQFEDELPSTKLPADFPRSGTPDFEGAAKNYRISRSLTKSIKQFCAESDSTLFMFLLNAVNILVYRYTSQKDIVLGSPISGRSHSDLEDQIGLFVNMLVFRTKVRSEMTFAELLAAVKDNATEAYQHSMYPFAQLVEDIDSVYSRNGENIFDIVVQLQNAKLNKTKNLQFDGVKVKNYLPNSYTSKFDITFNFEDLEDEESISLDIEYKTGLFSESTINRLKEDLVKLFTIATENNVLTLKEMRNALLNQGDQRQVNRVVAIMEKGISTDY